MELTIVLPTYNVAEYVAEAVYSIVDEISGNLDIELVIIDDGSTDGTWEYLSELGVRPNVRTFRFEHKGLGAARNVGIEIAEGRYVMFVDGDDYLERGWLQPIKKAVKFGNNDLIIFQWQSVTEYGEYRGGPYAGPTFSGMSMACWNKVYRREFVEAHKFPENVYFEDAGYSMLAWEKASVVQFVPNVIYSHRHRMDGISRRKHSFNDHMGVMLGLDTALRNEGSRLSDVKNMAADTIVFRVTKMVRDGECLQREHLNTLQTFYDYHGLYVGHFDQGWRHFMSHLLVNLLLKLGCLSMLNDLFANECFLRGSKE